MIVRFELMSGCASTLMSFSENMYSFLVLLFRSIKIMMIDVNNILNSDEII